QNGAAPAGAGAPAPRGPGGGGAAARLATSQAAPQVASAVAPQPTAAQPQPRTFTEVVALFETRREPRLFHHLMHHAHEVRCEPGIVELRLEQQAPRDLAANVGALLSQWTGRRWLVSVSSAPGKPTLMEQKAAQGDAMRNAAETNATVQAILKTFPGAKIDSVKRKGEQTSMVAGLGGDEPLADEAPLPDEYPADDGDIPESDS
ncbi:MAG: DNA polymerase III subunit gamma/tau, partial [Proteobacteria bacterium]|nr:DNA polymerase III subunit gamma/tau [Pseudomonadota bacterium]